MKYTCDEVMQYVREEDVKFIRLAFCDIDGDQKNLSIMPVELEKAFKEGISFDGGLRLIPDPSTLAQLTWRPDHGRVIRMFCRVCDGEGNTDSKDIRSILEGLETPKISIVSQLDFYLFTKDDGGNPTSIPFDRAGYLDLSPLDKCENIRRSVCLTLEEMGCTPISSCHSYGPGQNRISFKSDGFLAAADDLCTYRMVVKNMAAASHLHAEFSLKSLTSFKTLEYFPDSTLCVNLGDEGEIRFLPDAHPYLVYLLLAKSVMEKKSLSDDIIDPVFHPLLEGIKTC